MTELETLQQYIDQAKRIVFFGGAGVSTESGVPDFRSQDGLYHQQWKYPPETILSHSFFVTKTAEFYDFYQQKMLFLEVQPNGAHKKLAELEAAGKLSAVITQNIDGLHQAAGSQVVYELHGSVHRNRCMECGKLYDVHAVADCEGIPHCTCGGIIKPEVVLYEEPLDDQTVTGAVNAIASADTMIIAGTSLRVYPAAGLIRYFGGEHLICIDPAAKEMRGAVTLPHPVGKLFEKIHLS